MKRLLLTPLLCLFLATAAYAEGVIDMNKATVEELLSIPDTNMSKELAQAIVDYRTKNGPFTFSDDLLKVPGMSNEVWQRMMLIDREDGSVVYDPDAEEMPTFAPSKC